MPTRWTKIQALSAVTASPWTRDLRHVGAVFPRYWSQRQTYRDPSFKAVKPKDRITWWNIVPGDQVRVRGAAGDIREVFRINKLNNMVLLKKEVQVRVRFGLGGATWLTDWCGRRMLVLHLRRIIHRPSITPGVNSTLGSTNFLRRKEALSRRRFRML